jgi:hypothetical protein
MELLMSAMTLPQIKDELSTALKSATYIEALLDLAEAGDVVDEQLVDTPRCKQVYWSLRKGRFRGRRARSVPPLSGMNSVSATASSLASSCRWREVR